MSAIRAATAAVLAATLLQTPSPRRAPSPPERGPAVGQRLPPFEAPDQDGRSRSFESLRGPKGLVLVFFQSADW